MNNIWRISFFLPFFPIFLLHSMNISLRSWSSPVHNLFSYLLLFESTPLHQPLLLAKYWDAIKAVRLLSVWSKLLITVATVSWITLLKAFMKCLHFLLIQISNDGYATVKKEIILILWHISSKTRHQQLSVENIYIRAYFRVSFCFLIAKFLKQEPSLLLPAYHTTLNNKGRVDEAKPFSQNFMNSYVTSSPVCPYML